MITQNKACVLTLSHRQIAQKLFGTYRMWMKCVLEKKKMRCTEGAFLFTAENPYHQKIIGPYCMYLVTNHIVYVVKEVSKNQKNSKIQITNRNTQKTNGGSSSRDLSSQTRWIQRFIMWCTVLLLRRFFEGLPVKKILDDSIRKTSPLSKYKG